MNAAPPTVAAHRRASASRALLIVLGVLSGTTLLAMAGVTFLDVSGRALFDRPIPAAYELVQICQAVLVFAALPLATRARMHITMGVSLAAVGPRASAWLAVLVDIVSVLFLALFAWRLWLMADYLTEMGETLMFLRLPVGPLVHFMAAMSALSALYLAIVAVRERRGA